MKHSRQVRTNRWLEPRSSEITLEADYLRRREFLASSAVAVSALAWPGLAACKLAPPELASLQARRNEEFSSDEAPTDYSDATSYNNFYEFGADKGAPAKWAHTLRTDPWSVEIAGEVTKPGKRALEDLLAPHSLEERIYRLRCVEAWSMVIPWIGIPLADVIKRLEPTSRAKFVSFETLFDTEQMPGQRSRVLPWPYREALRVDEATHPLALLGVGMYGKVLPNQNGAPLRLVVPWKYGFKSIKSIVRIELTEKQPPTTWNVQAPREYGFYANVNPEVSHPRWSQKRERRNGEFRKQPTQAFNGYAELVADLYRGLDLRKNF